MGHIVLLLFSFFTEAVILWQYASSLLPVAGAETQASSGAENSSFIAVTARFPALLRF